MIKYVPKYEVEMRKSKGPKGPMFAAPWIIMPDDTAWNVWDVPEKEYTEDVEMAIKHAFNLGMRAQRMYLRGIEAPQKLTD